MDVTFLLNECLKLNMGTKEEINAKIENILKINNILTLQGCKLIKKGDGRYVLVKTPKPLAVFDPDLEIEQIISSKDDIPTKLRKIEKIVKNFEIRSETKDKLMRFFDKLDKIVNKKIKKEIKSIKEKIRVKSRAYA